LVGRAPPASDLLKNSSIPQKKNSKCSGARFTILLELRRGASPTQVWVELWKITYHCHSLHKIPVCFYFSSSIHVFFSSFIVTACLHRHAQEHCLAAAGSPWPAPGRALLFALATPRALPTPAWLASRCTRRTCARPS
jgi:hypothetical protein